MDVLEAIYSRRSVRQFTAEPVTAAEVEEILQAGSWAPSGLNNQPWRFVVVREQQLKGELAKLTKYSHIVNGAAVLLPVFCDREAMYSDIKDHQGVGACLQNMLLAAHGLGLGAVWLGEILNNSAAVNKLLELPLRYELMAVLAIGRPAKGGEKSTRKKLGELLLKEL